MKHAYLIMAHNNFYILDKLLRLLDDPINDIYLHIDKKVKDFDFDGFRNVCTQAAVYYPKKRINVQWGTQSQVLTEMLLYKTAFQNGPYHYYHLLSGVDLPLKSQRDIQDYFSQRNECYMFFQEEATLFDYQRVSRYHGLFGRKGKFAYRLNSYLGVIQERLNVDRLHKKQITVKKGSNWASLPEAAIETLLRREKEILRLTRFSVCADELYKQTILVNEGTLAIVNNDLREIWWLQGANHPHTYEIKDYDRLVASKRLFARKFDTQVDLQVVDKLYAHICGDQ